MICSTGVESNALDSMCHARSMNKDNTKLMIDDEDADDDAVYWMLMSSLAKFGVGWNTKVELHTLLLLFNFSILVSFLSFCQRWCKSHGFVLQNRYCTLSTKSTPSRIDINHRRHITKHPHRFRWRNFFLFSSTAGQFSMTSFTPYAKFNEMAQIHTRTRTLAPLRRNRTLLSRLATIYIGDTRTSSLCVRVHASKHVACVS